VCVCVKKPPKYCLNNNGNLMGGWTCSKYTLHLYRIITMKYSRIIIVWQIKNIIKKKNSWEYVNQSLTEEVENLERSTPMEATENVDRIVSNTDGGLMTLESSSLKLLRVRRLFMLYNYSYTIFSWI
jgi:hypothetical protein